MCNKIVWTKYYKTRATIYYLQTVKCEIMHSVPFQTKLLLIYITASADKVHRRHMKNREQIVHKYIYSKSITPLKQHKIIDSVGEACAVHVWSSVFSQISIVHDSAREPYIFKQLSPVTVLLVL